MDPIATFAIRLRSDWLPAFCGAPHRGYSASGFKEESIAKLSEFDAHWFLIAVDSGLVTQSDGFFVAPQSRAREQIFWQGSKDKRPRPITLWLEPVITIGALSRLAQSFAWPIECLGMQSTTWAFDLVGYAPLSGREQLVCEVKKDSGEVDSLLKFMYSHCGNDPLEREPADTRERNAYRKVQGIRRAWPRVFWALGPSNAGKVCIIRRHGESERFRLEDTDESGLRYPQGLATGRRG